MNVLLIAVAMVVYRPNSRNKDVWIGLYKTNLTEWHDDSQSPYRNWATGQPVLSGICVRLSDDGFQVKNCNKDHRYICKKYAGCSSFFCLVVFVVVAAFRHGIYRNNLLC